MQTTTPIQTAAQVLRLAIDDHANTLADGGYANQTAHIEALENIATLAYDLAGMEAWAMPTLTCDQCGETRADVRVNVPGQDGPRCAPCSWSTLDHFIANAHDDDYDPSPAELRAEMRDYWRSADVGQRVELAPHLDRWMRGDRFGVIVKRTPKRVHVLMDRSGQTLVLSPDLVTEA